MSKKTFTLDEAVQRGINLALDNIEVKAKITVRDKDGNIKGNFTATKEVQPNVTK
jgi:hypothetical protein